MLTGPLSVTTIHPMYGELGVDNANASVRDNVSLAELHNISDMEIIPLADGVTTVSPTTSVSFFENFFTGGGELRLQPGW